MAAKNRANGPDVNGTEQKQTDLFQNLEKLIASAVSICRLDGSVQCQIGGLITVIEELQRLLRHSFTEIKRLERSVEDQKRNLEVQEHTFTNNVSNLHYKVKEVQSSIETLQHQSEEARKSEEKSSADQPNSSNERGVEPPQISLVDESYDEESDGSIPNNLVQNTIEGSFLPNNHVDNTLADTSGNPIVVMARSSNNHEDNTLADRSDNPIVVMARSSNNHEDNTLTDTRDEPFVDLSQPKESTGPDPRKEAGIEDMGEKETTTDKVTTPPRETPSTIAPDSMLETATSTTEERESALRSLRSTSSSQPDTSSSQRDTSSSPDEKPTPRKNHLTSRTRSPRIEAGSNRTILSLRKSHHGKSPLAIANSKTPSPKTSSSQYTIRKGTPPKASLSKQLLKKNAAKVTPPSKPARKIKPSPQKQITPKRPGKSLSPSELKRMKLLVKSPQRPRELSKLSKVQKKVQASVKQPRKSLGGGSIKNSKVLAKSPTKYSPLKTRNDARLSISPSKRNQVLDASKKKSKTASTLPIPSEENPMDKYINLDFLLNANQMMSELVSDSDREEGTLDTASEVERRYIVDLAKLYRLRVRMADKCDGELPVALIKGRESSLPKTGQVDRLLYRMTHAMAIKTKSAANKHKLVESANRRSIASPTKKRRV